MNTKEFKETLKETTKKSLLEEMIVGEVNRTCQVVWTANDKKFRLLYNLDNLFTKLSKEGDWEMVEGICKRKGETQRRKLYQTLKEKLIEQVIKSYFQRRLRHFRCVECDKKAKEFHWNDDGEHLCFDCYAEAK